MRHEHAFGMLHLGLQVGREQARGGGTDEGVGPGGRIDLVDDAALQRQPFGHAFLNPVNALDPFLNAPAEGEFAARRQRRHGQHAIGAFRIRHDLADDALGFRMRVEDVDVYSCKRKTRSPGPADDAAADTGGLGDCGHSPLLDSLGS